jgi:hypothetical protein
MFIKKIKGRGVKEDLMTVAKTIGKYDPAYNVYKKIKGRGTRKSKSR